MIRLKRRSRTPFGQLGYMENLRVSIWIENDKHKYKKDKLPTVLIFRVIIVVFHRIRRRW